MITYLLPCLNAFSVPTVFKVESNFLLVPPDLGVHLALASLSLVLSDLTYWVFLVDKKGKTK